MEWANVMIQMAIRFWSIVCHDTLERLLSRDFIPGHSSSVDLERTEEPDHVEWSFLFGPPESMVTRGCRPVSFVTIVGTRVFFLGPLVNSQKTGKCLLSLWCVFWDHSRVGC
jgi:hypothetical protein